MHRLCQVNFFLVNRFELERVEFFRGAYGCVLSFWLLKRIEWQAIGLSWSVASYAEGSIGVYRGNICRYRGIFDQIFIINVY